MAHKKNAQYHRYFYPAELQVLRADIVPPLPLLRRPVEQISPAEITELDETHWYAHEGDSPTCQSILQHMKLIGEVDLRYPIILDRDGRVMDGMHRVCRAVREGIDRIPAVRFTTDPEPDFVGLDPDELPYDD